jgi:erythromycin esterase
MPRFLSLVLVLLLSSPLEARGRAVRSPGGGVGDDGLVRLVGDARVVALGDATHGTHETYAAKQRLVPLLVGEGFRTIAFEAPYAEWVKLNEYVRFGTGDPAEALAVRMYWFWDTDEILDLVRWARAQNEAGLTPPIRITGVDSTEPATAAELVVNLLRRVDPVAAEEAAANYACLGQMWLGATYCQASVEVVRPAIEKKRALYVNASSPDEVDELLHAARMVEQGERILASYHDARDEFMAENINRLVARGEKVIVLGHNEHWGQTPYRLVRPELIKSAGMYLSEALGDSYFSLGSVILDGTFLAIDYERGPGYIRPQLMTAPSSDDVAVLLERAGLETMIVPVRGLGTYRMRIAGSSVQSRDRTMLEVTVDLGGKFDAVLFVRRSTPTRLRNWYVF